MIRTLDYPDSRLSGLFSEVPTSPDNRGSTVETTKLAATKVKIVGNVITIALVLKKTI